MMRRPHTYVIPLLILGMIGALASFVSSFPNQATSAAYTPLTGYAWSETIGWISLHCDNDSSCGTSNYGLMIDVNGYLSGRTWSETVGWISANDFSGCPAGTCQPQLLPSGEMRGWLRVISGTAPPTDTQNGGWDGWISLSCVNTNTCVTSNYGPVAQPGGDFVGYAWGSTVVGWVDFQYAQTAFVCTPTAPVCTDATHISDGCTTSVCPYAAQGYGCDTGTVPDSCQMPSPPTGSITVAPRLLRSGKTVQVTWSVTNANPGSCTVHGNNGDAWDGLASSPLSGMTSSPITGQTIYTLHCGGEILGSFDAQDKVNIVPVYRPR